MECLSFTYLDMCSREKKSYKINTDNINTYLYKTEQHNYAFKILDKTYSFEINYYLNQFLCIFKDIYIYIYYNEIFNFLFTHKLHLSEYFNYLFVDRIFHHYSVTDKPIYNLTRLVGQTRFYI